jgi:hypothetical protein
MCRGIGKWIDDLQLFDDRAGPAVRDDERHRIFMFRTNVKEMNVQPVDLGHELRQGVQFGLAFAPIVICPPIARDFLNRRELHALRFIGDRFPVRPPCRVDAPAQIDQRLFRNVDQEGADFVARGRRRRIRGKKARGTHRCNSHRGGAQELAPVLIDNFGTWSRTHRYSPRSLNRLTEPAHGCSACCP